MRFYGMTDTECMRMPFYRFMALYRKIGHLQLEEEARQLTIVHNGDPSKRLKEIMSILRPNDHSAEIPVGAMLLMNTPGVRAESEAGSILKLRERQKESALRLKAEYDREKAEYEQQGKKLVVIPEGLERLS